MRRATILATLVTLTLASVIQAAAPQLINFQGLLSDNAGDPVADASYSVVFTIYDAATGGASVWTETQSVSTTTGLFTVLLGSVNPISDAVFNGTNRYLGIKVGVDPELAPRTALVSVPYAHRVSTIDGASGGALSSGVTIGSGNTLPASGSGLEQALITGESNSMTGFALNSAIVGGSGNSISSGSNDVIIGGTDNIASGGGSVVIGGSNSFATGNHSIAAGVQSKATHSGTFVWGDFSGGAADFVQSSANNQFTIRAAGGTRFFSNTALTTGVTLAPGGGAWAAVSDRNVKENIRSVDGSEILEKLSQLDVSRWNYISQDESIEHIGPMAQDFYELFAVGDNNTTITTIDPDGISLAAIKALYEKSKRVDALEVEVAKLKKLVERMLEQNDK